MNVFIVPACIFDSSTIMTFPCKGESFHYVFMLILTFLWLLLKFLDLREIFYISGQVTMSTLQIRVSPSVCPSVCRQIKWTSPHKVTNQFSRFIHIWIKQDVEKKSYKEKILNFGKKYRQKTNIQKRTSTYQAQTIVFVHQ